MSSGFSDSSSQAMTPTLGPLLWCPQKPPNHSSLWGCLHSLCTCTPSWPGGRDSQVHLSAELSWEPSSANGPEPSPSGACLQTVGVHGSASQPPSWARAVEPKHRPLLSSSQHQALPRWAETARACLPPASGTARSLPEAQGDAQSPRPQPWDKAGPEEGREPTISQL